MSTTQDSQFTLVRSTEFGAATRVADEGSLLYSETDASARRRGWQRVIDFTLIEWGRDSSQLQDDDAIPPSPEALGRAVDIAMHLRNEGMPCPNRAVPNGDGGVVFERWDGPFFEAIEIHDDGGIVLSSFKDGIMSTFERIA